jgi:Helix-turn-helix domain
MSSVLQNGQAAVLDVRQQFLLEMEEVASTIVNGDSAAKGKKPRSQKRPRPHDHNGADTLAVAQLFRDALDRIEARLTAVESYVREIHSKTVLASTVKEYYTTQEVARILAKRPYTVREWCRLGRVHGEKSHSGRGVDEEWRISHEELLRIQNEGLLTLKRSAAVERPTHLK